MGALSVPGLLCRLVCAWSQRVTWLSSVGSVTCSWSGFGGPGSKSGPLPQHLGLCLCFWVLDPGSGSGQLALSLLMADEDSCGIELGSWAACLQTELLVVAALMPPNLLQRRRDVRPAREALLNRFLLTTSLPRPDWVSYRCCSPGARSGLLQSCASLFCFLTPEVVGSRSGVI